MALLSISNVKKAFNGVYALKGVTFSVEAGECIALVGENGAGKSTLMKILSGVWPSGSYEGEAVFEDKALKLFSPLDGRRVGISIIHQELCLFPKLTVAENLFLTEAFPYDGVPSQKLLESVHWNSLFEKAQKLFSELGFEVNARALVEDLSVAQRQLVEIARAVHHQSKLLILDEPTSALSQGEVENLFKVIDQMKQTGIALIYISHKLDEVFRLSNRIVVLRDGQTVQELQTDKTDSAEVIRHMVGRPIKEVKHEVKQAGDTVFEVKDLKHFDEDGREQLSQISFSVGTGEVLGIAGLMGSGRSELLRSILGILPGQRSGQVLLQGKPVRWQHVREAISDGVAFVPEDRKKDGLFLDHGIDFNLTISILKQLLTSWKTLDLKLEASKVKTLAESMRVRFSQTADAVKVLSGGNQQKVLLAKVVASSPKVLMLDEPTRGIDIGAKEEIYEIIRKLAAQGLSVIMVSSELPEILALSDRVLVLREGRAVGELINENLSQERVMAFAAGDSHAKSAYH